MHSQANLQFPLKPEEMRALTKVNNSAEALSCSLGLIDVIILTQTSHKYLSLTHTGKVKPQLL